MRPKLTLILCLSLVVLLLVSGLTAGLLASADARRDAQGMLSVSPDLPSDESVVEDDADLQQEPGTVGGDTDEETKEARVSFLAAGDVVLHESVFLDANRRAGGSGASGSVGKDSVYDFLPMFSEVKNAITSADLSMVNQETLIAAAANGVPQGYPGFTGPEAAGDVLSAIGFDLVNVGNNHMLDQGSAGLRRSMEYWKGQERIRMIGSYASKAECDDICLFEIKGVKIAVLPYLGQTPATNGNSPDDSLYIPYLNEELVRSQVTRAREEADCVIVTVHWGNEGTYTPNYEQTSYASMFASLGVDALIGTHPHVLQPMQWLERSGYENGGKMLLCYSIGDFLSHTQLAGGKNALGNLLGGYVTFDIVPQEAGVVLENVRFVPTVSHYDETQPLDTGFCIYPLEDYTQELLSCFGDPNAGFTQLSQLESIVKQNIPDEFLN